MADIGGAAVETGDRLTFLEAQLTNPRHVLALDDVALLLGWDLRQVQKYARLHPSDPRRLRTFGNGKDKRTTVGEYLDWQRRMMEVGGRSQVVVPLVPGYVPPNGPIAAPPRHRGRPAKAWVKRE